MLVIREVRIDTVKTEIIEGDARTPKIHSSVLGARTQRKKSSLSPQLRQQKGGYLGRDEKNPKTISAGPI